MNVNIVKILVKELSKQFKTAKVNTDLFFKILSSTYIKKSTRFSEKLPNSGKQLIDESNNQRYHYLKLQRILRNENAKNYLLNGVNSFIEATKSKFGYSNSTSLTRNLRTKQDLVDLLSSCDISPFSLLAEFKTFDYGNFDEKLYIIKQPILIIPEIKDRCSIEKWEKQNTKYYIDRIFGEKEITKAEYFNS